MFITQPIRTSQIQTPYAFVKILSVLTYMGKNGTKAHVPNVDSNKKMSWTLDESNKAMIIKTNLQAQNQYSCNITGYFICKFQMDSPYLQESNWLSKQNMKKLPHCPNILCSSEISHKLCW